jgi:NAD+ synthase (glutamine-hydrolysing)
MPQLRIALAQVNATVGDLDGNSDLIATWTARAHEQDAHLVVFPEMVLTGYPVEDLALRESFASASKAALAALAARLDTEGHGSVATVVSYLDLDEVGPRDAVAVLYAGRIVATQFKHHLPNYGVFDERRLFKPGQTLDVVRLHGLEVGMVICEDIWQEGGPVSAGGVAERGAVRAGQGRRAAAPGGTPRGGGAGAPGVREHGRRAGRPRVRR